MRNLYHTHTYRVHTYYTYLAYLTALTSFRRYTFAYTFHMWIHRDSKVTDMLMEKLNESAQGWNTGRDEWTQSTMLTEPTCAQFLDIWPQKEGKEDSAQSWRAEVNVDLLLIGYQTLTGETIFIGWRLFREFACEYAYEGYGQKNRLLRCFMI